MELKTATLKAKEYNQKYNLLTKVVEEANNNYDWYCGIDLEGLEDAEDVVRVVETFEASDRCPHCEDGKVIKMDTMIYSGALIPNEREIDCPECDGHGTLS